MSLPREFIFNEELSKHEMEMLSATTSPLQYCSVELPLETNKEASLSPSDKACSLLSIHSAPPEQSERPSSLILELPLANQVGAYLSALSPPEVEEDSLLTLSSVAARPLIAASKKLRGPASSNMSFDPPDGGYGWVVVFGAFMVQFWVAGLFKSYGVLYVEIMEAFPDSSESVASWIPAVLSTLCLALAPVSSALCEKYSCRVVVFIGGLLCAAGLAFSFFSTRLLHLLFTFGVLTGMGGGLSTTPGIVIVSQYFDKHRAMANGICVSGTAAGSFVFPAVLRVLVARYGLRGSMLVLGGGMLHVCVAACLYVAAPVLPTSIPENVNLLTEDNPKKSNCLEKLFVAVSQTSIDKKPHDDVKKVDANIIHPSLIEFRPPSDLEDEDADVLGVVGLPREVAKLRLRPTRSSSILHSVEDLTTDSTCVYKSNGRKISRSLYIKPPVSNRYIINRLPILNTESLNKENDKRSTTPIPQDEVVKTSCTDWISKYLDVSLLRSWQFGLLCASVALMSCGSPYALYYLPAYTVTKGHSKTAAGHLVAISAALDLCGRLSFGWLCDLHLFCRRKAYIVSILVAGISVLSLPSLVSWWALAIAAASYGLCLGCWFLLLPVLLADEFGTHRIASSYGLVRLFQSVAAISVPPTAGLIRDITGGYSWCFYGMGICMILGSIPAIIFHVTTTTKFEEEESNGA